MSETLQKTNLLGLTREKMEAFFLSIGEKKFRAEQVLKWIHHNRVGDFEQMTNLGKALREKLSQVAEIRAPEIVSENISKDGTRKWVVRVTSGSCVETVFIPEEGRGTLCISSQAGCALDCSFCSTGKQGFDSDLSAAEVIGQVWIAARSLNNQPAKIGRSITNVVMMGMGEPLLNFDNVVDAMNLMMDDLGYGISKRRVTLSTSGVVPALQKLGQVTDVSLALSLHAPNNALRDQLVPLNKKYPLEVLLPACTGYIQGLSDKSRSITIEYTLIHGVNDQPQHAAELIELLRDVPCKINLIPFNPFSLSDYKRPSNNALHRFQRQLQESGYNTTIRRTRGDDIEAACGQLAGEVQDRTRRSARYQQKRVEPDNQIAVRSI
ncbi:23S rRNA (adenine(2503)-C(2))-methyltransferase RlmN [Aestuariirhabdus sp. Z084]|uniref:23S rRNA (adenine(2503)-C(2))-methyltransferase RlmN n=1 Tax=Aestuariirhabdus haliotis TaxID=2918751 RepID=UPI00201B3537|nr:23S rRNA (adenine(2503)-C(2))-methyltransferase RlmN [Aestuariirhabdus haliotis]MCL6415363.1 23S rRNA (adenine(2503)-C(2))-methyltransferase RlmN [Aestuariirhabdus haliotis]MCL6419119.1 23S rRNA (adenine(2503)-C(2))-methyltransferase RlmN [Aestuariirhabdus haliotis]